MRCIGSCSSPVLRTGRGVVSTLPWGPLGQPSMRVIYRGGCHALHHHCIDRVALNPIALFGVQVGSAQQRSFVGGNFLILGADG